MPQHAKTDSTQGAGATVREDQGQGCSLYSAEFHPLRRWLIPQGAIGVN